MINIIAKPPYELRHLQRVSSIVRGEQIAAYLGNARLNPDNPSEDDVYIYVKPHIKPGNNFDFPKKSWVDIHEAYDLVEVLKRYPEVGVVAYGDLAHEVLSRELKNKIVNIPHHHVNFERKERKRDKIIKVGTTGSPPAWDYIPEAIKKGLEERGIKLELYSNFYPRTSVARFHESLDIHLHWRPFLDRKLSCPFKIINAASFGVPTIALEEPSFKEVEGCYLPVKTPEQFLEALDALMSDDELYFAMVDKCLQTAEKYHIENIAKLYQSLDI